MKTILYALSLVLIVGAWGAAKEAKEAPAESETTPEATEEIVHNILTEEEMAEGWKLLFDGTSTEGIRNFKKETLGKRWVVEDGTLHFQGKGEDADGWQAEDGGDIIITDKEYENYELRLDWKISTNGNSGIIYNVIESDDYDYVWQTGPEMQILDNVGHPDAKIQKHRASDLYDLIECDVERVNPAEEWNSIRLVVNNGKVEHWLNGFKVVETQMWTDQWNEMVAGSKFKDMPAFGTGKKGHVSLQDHGDKVWFRNIKIREI